MIVGLYTTVSTEGEARAIARKALEQRLCACVQIEPIQSLYRWKGEICDTPEVRLLFKTTLARQAALQSLVAALHPYEEPAIWSVRLDAVAPSYAAWIAAETGGA